MFRQILLDRRHRKWQRILWRESPNEPLQVYELKTVIYGMACSPFNAIRALRQCAIDNYEVIYDPSRAAAARHSILYNFYVDEYLDSVNSDEFAITRQLILGKWNSNCTHVLSAITGTSVSASELELNNSTTKVLGLYWDPVSDELFFKVGLLDDTSMHTKRKVLSEVAKLSIWVIGTPSRGGEIIHTGLVEGILVGSLVHLYGFYDASRKTYASVIYLCSNNR
ncbi:uncharacterized protein LOC120781507 [Bactrocera tryoni]|uniref:uncharacterized protein LOC120781507 n=1 Tax=Bactrocera tryoni TaxID=59916 RepID=UPI001A957A58|nr:uncharacterized protein LOC120781507 [Bactrocera tryoni]